LPVALYFFQYGTFVFYHTTTVTEFMVIYFHGVADCRLCRRSRLCRCRWCPRQSWAQRQSALRLSCRSCICVMSWLLCCYSGLSAAVRTPLSCPSRRRSRSGRRSARWRRLQAGWCCRRLYVFFQLAFLFEHFVFFKIIIRSRITIIIRHI